MSPHKHPFDGGPAADMSARDEFVAEIAGHGAFVTKPDGDFRFTAQQCADRAVEVADACLDALEQDRP